MGKIIDGIYYDSTGNPTFAGIVEFDGKFYYAAEEGKIIKGRSKVVRSAMSNNLVKHGTYYFDKNGVLVPSSYKKPHKVTEEKKKKTNNRIIITQYLLLSAIALIMVSVLISLLTRTHQKGFEKPTTSGITVTVPEFKEEVYLCSTQLMSYYKGESDFDIALKAIKNPYKPFVFEYDIKNAESAVLLLTEKNDLSDGVQYVLDLKVTQLSIDNLKTGTQYYYKVTASKNGEKDKEVSGTFKTANTNRFIYMKGLYNTRDIGGYTTADNKRVRQGLLIRGTEADGLVENSFYLKDRKDAEPFGFICDFDLRNGNIFNANYVSRFGPQVTHKFYNSPQYGGIFYASEKETLRQIFSELADKSNYPMYLHCTYGADRTGTVIFLLQGLLGVSEEDMLKEYKLTNIVFPNVAEEQKIQPVCTGLEGVPGNSINEKIHNYMVGTIGITEKQIENIRAIFLE